VLGDIKIVPDFEQKFSVDDSLWIYLQVYNMAIDEKQLEPRIEIEYIIKKDGKQLYQYYDLKGVTFRFMSGDRLILTGRAPIKKFIPGKYQLKILVHDTISGRTLERNTEFEISS